MSAQKFDLILRGQKHRSPSGTFLFVAFRALDCILQYGILAHGVGNPLLNMIGLSAITDGPAAQTGIGFIDGLGLSAYRLALLTMGVGSSLKHIFWMLFTSEETFPVSSAIAISIFNTTFNSLNNLLAISSPGGSLAKANVIFGGALYIGGIALETIAEIQRKIFKKDPKNQGKVYTGGLWSLARHINYSGYTLWRSGYTMVAGGWAAGFAAVGYLLVDFTIRPIPALDGYCSKKYKEQWAAYKIATPYAMVPGVY